MMKFDLLQGYLARLCRETSRPNIKSDPWPRLTASIALIHGPTAPPPTPEHVFSRTEMAEFHRQDPIVGTDLEIWMPHPTHTPLGGVYRLCGHKKRARHWCRRPRARVCGLCKIGVQPQTRVRRDSWQADIAFMRALTCRLRSPAIPGLATRRQHRRQRSAGLGCSRSPVGSVQAEHLSPLRTDAR